VRRSARLLLALALGLGSLISSGSAGANSDVAPADSSVPTATTSCGGSVSFSSVPAGWFLTITPGGDPDLLYSRTFTGITLRPGEYHYEWHSSQDASNKARADIHEGGGTFTISSCSSPSPSPSAGSDPVLIGAGDICHTGDEMDNAYATAALIEARPDDVVFTAGDNSNQTGSEWDYENCVAPTWGGFKDRTYPAPGNHDYGTEEAAAYYAFYPQAAGPSGLGWYSYDLANDWHVIVLNAMCDYVGGCETGSPQETWLRADLAANEGKHFIAIWHIPEFSSGSLHGNSSDYRDWWDDLYAAHASIIINGHDHDYERFAPQAPDGSADIAGIREFVVGTGGAEQRDLGTIQPNSQVHASGVYGVLELTLHADSYEWEFIPIAGQTFTDSGTTVLP
jgi:acid phosphatase type 7